MMAKTIPEGYKQIYGTCYVFVKSELTSSFEGFSPTDTSNELAAKGLEQAGLEILEYPEALIKFIPGQSAYLRGSLDLKTSVQGIDYDGSLHTIEGSERKAWYNPDRLLRYYNEGPAPLFFEVGRDQRPNPYMGRFLLEADPKHHQLGSIAIGRRVDQDVAPPTVNYPGRTPRR